MQSATLSLTDAANLSSDAEQIKIVKQAYSRRHVEILIRKVSDFHISRKYFKIVAIILTDWRKTSC